MWAISTLFQVIQSVSRQGSVQEYFTGRKFNCARKVVVKTTSEMQCVHHCLRNENCEIANYKDGGIGNVKQYNCEVFDVPSYHESCSSKDEAGWKTLILMVG